MLQLNDFLTEINSKYFTDFEERNEKPISLYELTDFEFRLQRLTQTTGVNALTEAIDSTLQELKKEVL